MLRRQVRVPFFSISSSSSSLSKFTHPTYNFPASISSLNFSNICFASSSSSKKTSRTNKARTSSSSPRKQFSSSDVDAAAVREATKFSDATEEGTLEMDDIPYAQQIHHGIAQQIDEQDRLRLLPSPPLSTQQPRNVSEQQQGEEESFEDDESENIKKLKYPNVLLVQLCDHMQHDQGVKRHAITVTFGSDGFHLSSMCKNVRKDLRSQLASSYWQMHQTQERSAFFVSTRISQGTADLLVTSMTQRVIEHVEDNFDYSLTSSYVTLSPDVQHTSVRMMYHYFIFRKNKNNNNNNNNKKSDGNFSSSSKNENFGERDDDDNEEADEYEEEEEEEDNDEEYERGQPEYRNFEPPKVGPQETSKPPKKVPKIQRVKKIWNKNNDE